MSVVSATWSNATQHVELASICVYKADWILYGVPTPILDNPNVSSLHRIC